MQMIGFYLPASGLVVVESNVCAVKKFTTAVPWDIMTCSRLLFTIL